MLLKRLRWAAYFARHLKGQARVPFLPLDVIERQQAARVRRMVAYAFATVPYYRETFSRLGLSPADFRRATDLARLPVIEREQIQRDPEYFCSTAPLPQDLLKISSGGSSGAPRRIFHDPRGVFENAAQGERERSIWTTIVGRRTGYRELVIAPPHSTTLKVQRYCRERGFYPRRVGIEREYASLLDAPEETIRHINAFRPHVVHSYGSYLGILFRHLAASDVQMHAPALVTYTSDGLAEPIRTMIEQRFRIPVFTTYQAVEAFKIAFECELHRGMHLNIDLYPLRVVDSGGRELPHGESGEVIVSNLVNRGTVLLNYRLGDIATVLRDRCSCGRSLPLLSYLQGRTDDLIELASGRVVHPQALRSLFNDVEPVWEYQVAQETDARFLVSLLTAPGCDLAATRRIVTEKVAQVLGGDVQIDVVFVTAIDRTIGGKFAPVISLPVRARRPQAGAAAD